MSTTFNKPLNLRDNGDYTFTLLSGFSYTGNGIRVDVPKGYVTDFASVPRALWNILPPHGPHGKAAVIHDFLYSKVVDGEYDRGVADAIFKQAMKDLNVGAFKKWTMYLGVRFFGWYAVRKMKKEKSTKK